MLDVIEITIPLTSLAIGRLPLQKGDSGTVGAGARDKIRLPGWGAWISLC